MTEAQALPGRKRGGRPIRKRGYHRALKRGETWALVEKGHREMIAALNRIWERPLIDAAMSDNHAFYLGLSRELKYPT